ncbi:LEAF RUST 10 DISEASE-RESISTANCE LOCUS RECEPTOR-LIKE PROTEIN KINASE-like 1.2 [Bienertia sinuspersici]
MYSSNIFHHIIPFSFILSSVLLLPSTMQPNKFFLSNLSYTLIILVLLLITKLVSSEQNTMICAPKKCGNLSSIGYPCWILNKQEPYCGHPHPNFKISCKNNTTPTIRISNDDYILTRVVYDESITCLAPSNNITLEHTPFSFTTNYADFLLFYNCSNLPIDFYLYFPINCKKTLSDNNQNAIYKSFGDFHYEELVERNYSLGLCESIVTAPMDVDMNMDVSQIHQTYWKMDYMQILRQGFTLNWTLDDCNLCETGGGKCNNKKDSKQTAIALGVGIAACVILSMILCFCFYRRHQKKKSSMQFLTHNKSYDAPSSGSSTQFLTGSTYFGVHVFNYRELEEATEYFNPSKELGEGGFGTVYYGKLKDGREVAIKRLYENNNKRAEQFLNEVEILANLRHNNLVNLYGCTSRQSRELLLVYEFVPNGTVADHLHGKQSKLGLLPWSSRLSIATETASALVYLHDSDIIHRDVKTQNILLETDFTVKVADFGLSRLFPLDVTHVSTAPQGTPGYVDPEYHQCYQLTEKSDVYSFGVMLAELISSLPAVDITRKRTDINLSNLAINKIQNHALHELVDSKLGFESDFKVKKEVIAVSELCFQCLQSTKEMRPSMNEVLKRLLTIQGLERGEMDSAEVLDIPADDVLMLKGDFSPNSPPREDTLANRYKPNASV